MHGRAQAGSADPLSALQLAELLLEAELPDGLDATEMGPLVFAEQLERVMGFLESGRREGVRIVLGGDQVEAHGYFVAPTVLDGAGPGNQVFDEEIFGPVVTAIPFSDPGEVAPAASETIRGLAAGIWTGDPVLGPRRGRSRGQRNDPWPRGRDLDRRPPKAHRLIPQLKAGTVWVNTYNTLDAALPFGSYQQSGCGCEMRQEVIYEYAGTGAVCIGSVVG